LGAIQTEQECKFMVDLHHITLYHDWM
jgi:hypothetical protein